MDESITFACQECGKSVTFPGDRRGHVEECPECGSYVDVPHHSDPVLLAESRTAAEGGRPTGPAADSRTSAQLWIEVFAVLCLAYFPYIAYAVMAFSGARMSHYSFVRSRFDHIVNALQVAMPLLVIMALSRDPWSLFGIVRPRWILDSILACAIWFGELAVYLTVITLLPASMLERSVAPHDAARAGPIGISSYFLLLTACIAGAFSEELVMRGYLIPRLERLLRSTWLAVVITSALFGSCHLYQGAASAISTAAGGLVYAIAFCLCRRLWPLCLAHALHNFLLYL